MIARQGLMFNRWRFEDPRISATRHDPPLVLVDPNTGTFFNASQTWRDAAGSLWAARADCDAAGRGPGDDGYDATMPHWLVVEVGNG